MITPVPRPPTQLCPQFFDCSFINYIPYYLWLGYVDDEEEVGIRVQQEKWPGELSSLEINGASLPSTLLESESTNIHTGVTCDVWCPRCETDLTVWPRCDVRRLDNDHRRLPDSINFSDASTTVPLPSLTPPPPPPPHPTNRTLSERRFGRLDESTFDLAPWVED